MKKVLMILGGIFIALIVLLVIGFVIFSFKGKELDRESKAYVDNAILAITSQWDIKEMEKRLSPEFKATLKDNDLAKMFTVFSNKLGPLKKYKGAKGDSHIQLMSGKGEVITAVYFVKADFTKGSAGIKISLIKHDAHWQIAGFYVNSRVFLEP